MHSAIYGVTRPGVALQETLLNNKIREGITIPAVVPSTRSHAMLSKELLDILACPQCHGPVTLTEAQDGLLCHTCLLLYEIRDDIPIMLIEEAKKLDKPGD